MPHCTISLFPSPFLCPLSPLPKPSPSLPPFPSFFPPPFLPSLPFIPSHPCDPSIVDAAIWRGNAQWFSKPLDRTSRRKHDCFMMIWADCRSDSAQGLASIPTSGICDRTGLVRAWELIWLARPAARSPRAVVSAMCFQLGRCAEPVIAVPLTPFESPLATPREPCYITWSIHAQPAAYAAAKGRKPWNRLRPIFLRRRAHRRGPPPMAASSGIHAKRSRSPGAPMLSWHALASTRAIEDVIFGCVTQGRCEQDGQFGRMAVARLLAARQRSRRLHRPPDCGSSQTGCIQFAAQASCPARRIYHHRGGRPNPCRGAATWVQLLWPGSGISPISIAIKPKYGIKGFQPVCRAEMRREEQMASRVDDTDVAVRRSRAGARRSGEHSPARRLQRTSRAGGVSSPSPKTAIR